MSKAPPTKRKLDKARREGKTVKSQILTGGMLLLALILYLKLAASLLVRNKIVLEYIVTEGARAPLSCLALAAKTFAVLAGSWILLAALIAVVLEGFKVGLVFAWEALAPNGERLSPAAGISRVGGGLRGLWRTIAVLVIFLSVAAAVLRSEMGSLVSLLVGGGGASPLAVLSAAWLRGTGFAALTMLVLGGVEHLLNRQKLQKELEMSIAEVRQEHKEDEGDPYIRAHRRAQHREMSYQAMVNKIRRSKVVVVERATA